MAISTLEEKYIPRDNQFYRLYYHYFLIILVVLIVLMMSAIAMVMYQVKTRPLPVFSASQPDGKKMGLVSFDEPNLLPETILRFASKAATTAYTFDFVNYNEQISLARPYFTDTGWSDFKASISRLIQTIVANQLFVAGVVSGPPVISNQGPLPDIDYAWRVQIPFLVTYQSANTTTRRQFYVVITIIRVPTSVNPQGIGVSQFVME